MAKKTVSEEAKEMLSSWKTEIEENDGDILESKRKRDEDNEILHRELKSQFKLVTEDLNEKAKKAVDVFNEEFKEFSQTVKEGTASLYKKAEIEKHAAQLLDFLTKVKSKGAEKFKEISETVKSKISEQEEELNSEVEKNETRKDETNDIETLIKQAQEEYEKKQ